VVDRNRALAAQLLAAADLWLFVTTAARYADAVPWELLTTARLRGTVIALVLDRVPADAAGEVSAHLREMLAAHDMAAAPLFVLPETTLDRQGLLPENVTRPLHDWFAQLAADATARAAVVRQTLDGALAALGPAAEGLAEAADDQARAAQALDERVGAAYRNAKRTVEQGLQDGRLLRGEVLARWQEFVGTGELLKTIESKVSWLRDRISNAVLGKPHQAGRVTVAVESGLQTLIIEHAEAAAERAAGSWGSVEAGRRLLEEGPDISRASRDFRTRTERTVRDWQAGVLDMVRTEGAGKRSTARFLAYGFNGLAVALMVVVFASTAAIPTGAEVGIGAGTAMVGQKVLEAVFGDQAVRRLAAAARKDLHRRVTQLMAEERQRFDDRLGALGLDDDAADRLRAAVRAVDDLRFAPRGGIS
jgi:hypothetical protein